MIRWLPLLKSFPKWVITALILIIGTGLFLVWWVTRSNDRSPNLAAGPSGTTEVGSSFNPEGLNFDEVLLCGNTLVKFETGQILTKEWLEGFNGSAPPIVRILPSEKLVICGNRGQAGAFGFDGKAKPAISVDGKPLGAAGFSFGDSRVIFVREGNLWFGRVNWQQSSVDDAKRMTDVGYFRDDTFRGEWFWHAETLFVPVQGRAHRVDLTNGSVTQDQANVGTISRGASPDGTKSAAALGRGNFVVVNFATGQAQQISIRGSFREFLWLDANRLAYGSDQNQISILDATTGKTEAFQTSATILKIAAASPKGESAMLGTSKGPMILSTKNGKFAPVNLAMDDGTWISEDALLCTNSSTDTTFRGVWLVGSDGTKEKVSGQPVDSNATASGARPMVAIPEGALWISGGNLWRYDLDAKMASQITQGEKLVPSVQLFPH